MEFGRDTFEQPGLRYPRPTAESEAERIDTHQLAGGDHVFADDDVPERSWVAEMPGFAADHQGEPDGEEEAGFEAPKSTHGVASAARIRRSPGNMARTYCKQPSPTFGSCRLPCNAAESALLP